MAKIKLSAISIDVSVNSDGTFDTWISTESSSGDHYDRISSNRLGDIVADLVECLAEESIHQDPLAEK